MKTWKKVGLSCLAVVVIGVIALVARFAYDTVKVREYSTYCMDSVRAKLWEELENIHMTDVIASEWAYVFMWWVRFDWVDYGFSCNVFNKENVDLKLDIINQKASEYDQDSWKDIIADDCMHFFDGCNSCWRMENWEVACTRMFCDEYQKPVCTDDQVEDSWNVE